MRRNSPWSQTHLDRVKQRTIGYRNHADRHRRRNHPVQRRGELRAIVAHRCPQRRRPIDRDSAARSEPGTGIRDVPASHPYFDAINLLAANWRYQWLLRKRLLPG